MAHADELYQRVLEKNTFYFYDPDFEEEYDARHITRLRTQLLLLYEKVRKNGVQKEYFDEALQRENGLRAILALNGFSNEQLNRVITLARVINDASLDELLNRKNWNIRDRVNPDHISEWGANRIEGLVRNNSAFRAGIVNLFFEGACNLSVSEYLPPFEVKKLSIEKLSFKTEAMVDILVRYKEKGSYSGKKRNNADRLIKRILDDYNLPYETGADLNRLLDSGVATKRTMDFIIPDQANPRIIIESSYQSTTSSTQGDKSKTEINVDALIHTYYRKAQFIGFVDGIGWYVRKRDLKRMVSAYDDVFTFHKDELERFRKLLTDTFNL